MPSRSHEKQHRHGDALASVKRMTRAIGTRVKHFSCELSGELEPSPRNVRCPKGERAVIPAPKIQPRISADIDYGFLLVPPLKT